MRSFGDSYKCTQCIRVEAAPREFPKKPAHVERTVIEPRMEKPKLSSDGSILGGSEGQGATNAFCIQLDKELGDFLTNTSSEMISGTFARLRQEVLTWPTHKSNWFYESLRQELCEDDGADVILEMAFAEYRASFDHMDLSRFSAAHIEAANTLAKERIRAHILDWKREIAAAPCQEGARTILLL